MKRIACIFLLLSVVLFLSGCRLIESVLEVSHPAPKLEEVITYAENNREALVNTAVYLLDTFSEESGGFTLSRLNQDHYCKSYFHTKNKEEEEVVLPLISPLFDDGLIYLITVRNNAVEYSVGGTGIASNTTYYDLI